MALNRYDIFTDAAKLSPPAGIVVSHLAGVDWSTVAYILTSIYTALMIVQHIWSKWIKPKLKN